MRPLSRSVFVVCLLSSVVSSGFRVVVSLLCRVVRGACSKMLFVRLRVLPGWFCFVTCGCGCCGGCRIEVAVRGGGLF